ncbi:MAG: helix-turn-helix domain-containing protein [Nitratireductor sp.]
MSDKDRQFVEALARGLAVLESLSRAQMPLTNGDLAKMTGLAPSTVSRLTHTLSVMGYVRLSRPNRAYELTPKNLTLGYPVLAGMRLLEQARPTSSSSAARRARRRRWPSATSCILPSLRCSKGPIWLPCASPREAASAFPSRRPASHWSRRFPRPNGACSPRACAPR